MPAYTLKINGQTQSVETDSQTPLLWVIREHLGLMGTKFGCGISQCGACTIHVDGHAMKACGLPISAMANGQEITTIEGLSKVSTHPLQQAWIEAQVPQCGYCQSGQIMQAATLLNTNPKPSREEILQHMRGNLCRCGTYMRIVKAIQLAAEAIQGKTSINEE
ncbi:isoquinoline 1-oxidoreductase alpha subunit [Catalinimonas alkaloidigena]|uniref:(2Fe-2S)-binding protein n=1 Tax=Catalinimonas alkaloidigena TaxID=1075417 RepID=UPI0024072371|nr:(2Fe-2S)-binding protein [Catalinimonas alkaloidigena]MDF9797946.1 isoquinoline 1-oxidoreductase alpha subunit [Catalinimonas alkaloidigena]